MVELSEEDLEVGPVGRSVTLGRQALPFQRTGAFISLTLGLVVCWSRCEITDVPLASPALSLIVSCLDHGVMVSYINKVTKTVSNINTLERAVPC